MVATVGPSRKEAGEAITLNYHLLKKFCLENDPVCMRISLVTLLGCQFPQKKDNRSEVTILHLKIFNCSKIQLMPFKRQSVMFVNYTSQHEKKEVKQLM